MLNFLISIFKMDFSLKRAKARKTLLLQNPDIEKMSILTYIDSSDTTVYAIKNINDVYVRECRIKAGGFEFSNCDKLNLEDYGIQTTSIEAILTTLSKNLHDFIPVEELRQVTTLKFDKDGSLKIL